MTASPSTASLATTITETQRTYLEDLFLHARGSSRTCYQSYEEQAGAIKAHPGSATSADALVTHENVIAMFLATIAPAAVAQMQLLAAIAPNYEGQLSQLEEPAIDAMMRRLFDAAGLSNDFITSEERHALYSQTAEFREIEERVRDR